MSRSRLKFSFVYGQRVVSMEVDLRLAHLSPLLVSAVRRFRLPIPSGLRVSQSRSMWGHMTGAGKPIYISLDKRIGRQPPYYNTLAHELAHLRHEMCRGMIKESRDEVTARKHARLMHRIIRYWEEYGWI